VSVVDPKAKYPRNPVITAIKTRTETKRKLTIGKNYFGLLASE
jgi:hypothetical protein